MLLLKKGLNIKTIAYDVYRKNTSVVHYDHTTDMIINIGEIDRKIFKHVKGARRRLKIQLKMLKVKIDCKCLLFLVRKHL